MAVRWGILGAGDICKDFATAFKLVDSQKNMVTAVAARDITKAREFAEKFGISKAYGSYTELAADKDIDAVYVGTINTVHENQVKLLLENDKHVLCEKPFMMNARQVRDVLQLAAQRKRFIMEAVWSRFFPAYMRVRSAIQSGEIGEVKFIQASFIAPAAVGRPRVAEKQLGGGGLLDIGIYCIQFITMVMDEKPERISATGQLNENGVDRACCVALHYSGGRLAQFNIHSELSGPIMGSITGTKGCIRMDEPFYCSLGVTVNEKYEAYPLPENDGSYVFGNSAGLHYEVIAAGDAIQQGLLEHPLMPHRHTEIICEVLDECRRQLGVVFESDQ